MPPLSMRMAFGRRRQRSVTYTHVGPLSLDGSSPWCWTSLRDDVQPTLMTFSPDVCAYAPAAADDSPQACLMLSAACIDSSPAHIVRLSVLFSRLLRPQNIRPRSSAGPARSSLTVSEPARVTFGRVVSSARARRPNRRKERES